MYSSDSNYLIKLIVNMIDIIQYAAYFNIPNLRPIISIHNRQKRHERCGMND